MRLPYLCKCGNWYTPMVMPEDAACDACALGQHDRRSHCHFGNEASSYSERILATTLKRAEEVKTYADTVMAAINIGEWASAEPMMTRLDELVAAVVKELLDVPRVMEWAGVMEMPGMAGYPNEDRYKSASAVQTLVEQGRRPREDLQRLQRSISVCKALAVALPSTDNLKGLVDNARRAIESRPAIGVAPPPVKTDNFAKARAAKVAKREAAKAISTPQVAIPA